MPTIESLRDDIRTLDEVGSYAEVMEMVSLADRRTAAEALAMIHPYAQASWDMLLSFVTSEMATREKTLSWLTTERTEGNPALLVITSDMGSAGRYDEDVITKALSQSRQWTAQPHIISVGEQGTQLIPAYGADVFVSFPGLPFGRVNYRYQEIEGSCITPIAEHVIDEFTKGSYRSVHIVYTVGGMNEPIAVVMRQLLPIQRTEGVGQNTQVDRFNFEPGLGGIVDTLWEPAVYAQIAFALLCGRVAESSIRSLAMHDTMENAQKQRKQLEQERFGLMHEEITNEIILTDNV